MSDLGEWDEVDVDPETGEVLDEPAGHEPEAEAGPPPLYYGSVDEFLREMIVPVFRRKIGDRSDFRWAADWWRHPEAVIRLEALWWTWEHLRLDPATGMSVWLRDHLDHHLPTLLSQEGPFGKAKETSERGAPLPYNPPPAGLFTDVREAAFPDEQSGQRDSLGSERPGTLRRSGHRAPGHQADDKAT